MAKKFTVELNAGNSAFGDDPETRGAEIARILRTLADSVEVGDWNLFKLLDINGNTVGEAQLKEETSG